VGPINFEHIQKYVDGFITVTEDEIKRAMRQLLFSARILAEPSGAVTTAAAMFHTDELEGSGPVIAVVSGGNVEPRLFTDVLQGTI
jgi:threonine dehydratase